MERILLDDIRFEPDVPQLLEALRLDPREAGADKVRRMAEEAQRIARPKALYRVAYVEERSDEAVVIDGVRLGSRVLRVNLDQVHRAFPYVATCGQELEEWSRPIDDLLESWWAGTIKETALRAARVALLADLEERFQPGPTSEMNPGSLEDWPISQQRPLFDLLGGVRETIGVELTDSYLMVPIKSVSGLRFPTETGFFNCQLCPRPECPSRRAPYDRELYERKYRR